MCGYPATVYNHTTGDVVENKSWTAFGLSINQLAHQFSWEKTDKIVMVESNGVMHKCTYNDELHMMEVTGMDEDDEHGLNELGDGKIVAGKVPDSKIRQRIVYDYEDTTGCDAITISKEIDGQQHTERLCIPRFSFHFPTWTDSSDHKVCAKCLSERSSKDDDTNEVKTK